MKATLKFDLPDEDNDHRRAVKALDLALALWGIDDYLRGIEKWERGYDIEGIRAEFYSILEKYDINLDKLIE